MKLGDFVRVRYRGSVDWSYGIIVESPDEESPAMWKMWCGEREAVHILAPNLDEIEVINESR